MSIPPNKKLIARIMAWTLSFLMVGSVVAAAIVYLFHAHG